MADWKDFYEDNKESFGRYLDSLAERKGSTHKEKTPRPRPLQFCPLCHAAFLDAAEVASHVRAIHGPQHVYLRVNGRITRDIGWAEQGISELQLVLLGFSDAPRQDRGKRFREIIRELGRIALR